MARNLGQATVPTTPSTPPPTNPATRPAVVPSVSPAERATRPGWRDPRMWVGIAIVAASVVAGARLLAAADDTVRVWSAATDMGAGDRVTEDDLVATDVRFADDDALAGYFTADQTLPADMQLTRGVAEGELLPRSAIGSATQTGLVELPLAVEPEQVPPSVGAGAVVDVYVVGAASAAEEAPAAQDGPVLSGVTVVDAPALSESFGTTGRRQLVLAVPEADASRFFSVLGRYDAPVLTVVRRG